MQVLKAELKNMQASISNINSALDFNEVAESDPTLLQAILCINDDLDTIADREEP